MNSSWFIVLVALLPFTITAADIFKFTKIPKQLTANTKLSLDFEYLGSSKLDAPPVNALKLSLYDDQEKYIDTLRDSFIAPYGSNKYVSSFKISKLPTSSGSDGYRLCLESRGTRTKFRSGREPPIACTAPIHVAMK